MTAVTLLRDRYVHGWPNHERGDPALVLELGEALELKYSTDAHLAAYVTPNGRRLARDAIDAGVGIKMTCVIFDLDCEETHGGSESAPNEWRVETRTRVRALNEMFPDIYYYETRGGSRIVYRLDEPVLLRSHDDAREWSTAYAVAVAYLKRQFGIVADPACADWQRLFRLPHATRADRKPENWPIWGNPDRIGTLVIQASREDVAVARATSKAFNKSRPLDLKASGSGDDGLLYWALRNRGDVGKEAARGGWICRCPNREQHSRNSDGTDSTVVYPAARDSEIGALNCLHAHCANFTTKQWLGLFSDSELQAARRNAGIVRAA